MYEGLILTEILNINMYEGLTLTKILNIDMYEGLILLFVQNQNNMYVIHCMLFCIDHVT